MNKLANAITNILAENGFIKSEDYAACQYGIEVFLISATEIGCILFTSIFLKNSIETILWLATFIPIRIYAGGYHADTRLKCFGAFIITYVIFSLLITNIRIYPRLYLFMVLLTTAVILKWAPLQHQNKHVSDPEKCFYRKMSVIWVSIEGTIAIAILLLNIKHIYAIAVLYGLFTAGISLLIGNIKNNYVRRSKQT